MAEEPPRIVITGTGAHPTATNEVSFGSAVSSVPSDDPVIAELRRLASPLVLDLARHDSAVNALASLTARYTPQAIHEDGCPREWELVGLYFFNRWRWHEALGVFRELYYQLVRAQDVSKQWIHKGLPLVWICDCYHAMGYAVHAKRYLMLTLCEDALRAEGAIPPQEVGSYFRAVWRHGISDQEFHRIASDFYRLSREFPDRARFPEALLQELSSAWQGEIPSSLESGTYIVNPLYVSWLIDSLGEKTGRALERLAQYLIDCMPGCRTMRRAITPSTDYDLVCSVEGFEVDFRAEFGRYFLCECKDWDKPANFSTIAKFCRVLDSVKARLGVLFSKNGVTGEGRATDSEREILKYFQDSGKVIVVVTEEDLKNVKQGNSFVRMLRAKYESVRLDLRG